MNEITTTAPVHTGGLHAAVEAELGELLIGISEGGGIPTRIHLTTLLSPEQDAAQEAIIDAHDPVFISTDRENIIANNSDIATITVRTLKQGAAAVTLLVDETAVPVTMVDGVGTVTIKSADPTVITVSVQNPENRTTDVLTIEAV